MKFKIKNNFGFSLIELSVVLIIIGLLVAGVTGGASLIQSAKLQGIAREFRDYERMFYQFKMLEDRLPGDLNKTGKIGMICNGCTDPRGLAGGWTATPTSTNFGGKFKGVAVGNIAGPFVDLFLSGINDFEPKGTLSQTGMSSGTAGTYIGKITPIFKSDKTIALDSFATFVDSSSIVFMDYARGAKGVNLRAKAIITGTKPGYGAGSFTAKSVKRLDEKMDDGVYNSGSVRAHCSNTTGDGYAASYDLSIRQNYGCHTIIYRIM